MRICIDIQPAIAQRAGVGRYTKNLAENLGAFAGQDEVRLFYFDFRGRGLSFTVPNTQIRPCRCLPGRIVQNAWKRFDWPPFDWFSGRADLYHFPNFTIPPLASRARRVVTIHDMSFFRYPQFAEERNLRFLRAMIHSTASRADAIITDSRFSSMEIVECLGVKADIVHAVHLGVSPDCCRASGETVAALRRHFDLRSPYLLTVGTLEPRKNLEFMVSVFEQLKDFDGDLVIAGMRGWKYEPILQRMRNSSRAARIRYLEYVPDEDLPALYSGAELFLTTSFYEGFGFPPLEAMACGTPVVSSAGGSLAEVLGDKAVVLHSWDTQEWVHAIEGTITNEELRNRLSNEGPPHAKAYDWRKTACQTFTVYRRVLS